MTTRHRAFGLDFEAAFSLTELPELAAPGSPDGTLRLASPTEIETAWSGPDTPARVRETRIDAAPYRAEAGATGDLLMSRDDARFHLSPDHSSLLCAPVDAEALGWRRLLLDTILATVSMRHGFELIHAGAVATENGVVAVIAGTGGGKSTLLAELLRRGGRLFCDDLLTIRAGGDAPICEPGPPLMNLANDGPSDDAELGRELGRFDEETWVAVDRYCAEPGRLAAFVLLDRTPDATVAELIPLDMPHLVFMAAALDTGRSAERRELRFRLMSDLATTTPGLRLRAPLEAAPADLAALAEWAIASQAVGTQP